MKATPIPNRSFLYGNCSSALISEKVEYVTLDNLALRPSRLPLRVLPIDDGNVIEKVVKADANKEAKRIGNKSSPSKRPSFKVRSGASAYWKMRAKPSLPINGKFKNVSPTTESCNGNTTPSIQDTSILKAHDNVRKNQIKCQKPLITKNQKQRKSFANDSNQTPETITSRSDGKTETKQEEIEPNKSLQKNGISFRTGLICNLIEETLKTHDIDTSNNSTVFYGRKSRNENVSSDENINTNENSTIGNQNSFINTKTKTSKVDISEIDYGDSYKQISTFLTKREGSCTLKCLINAVEVLPNGVNLNNENLESTKVDDEYYDNVEPTINESSLHRKSLRVSMNKDCQTTKYVCTNTPNDQQTIAETKAAVSDMTANSNSISSSYSTVNWNEFATKKKRKFAFAKNVLNYVPISNHVKRYRKSRKFDLSTSTCSLKSFVDDEPKNSLTSQYAKSRSLSRDELKYVTISLPTNFIHVASATKSRLINGESIFESQHFERKFVDLRDNTSGYVEIKKESLCRKDSTGSNWSYEPVEPAKVENSENDQVKIEEKIDPEKPEDSESLPPRANYSFLWGDRMKERTINGTCEDSTKSNEVQDDEDDGELYDDVGLPTNCVNEEDEYDDVGPPLDDSELLSKDSLSIDEEVYDDVMPVIHHTSIDYSCDNTMTEKDISKTDEPGISVNRNTDTSVNANNDEMSIVRRRGSSNADYWLVDDAKNDLEDESQGVYDDVGLPSQERVNSLYASTSIAGSQPCSNWFEKESEWEDVEDMKTEQPPKKTNFLGGKQGEAVTVSKKKLTQQRWTKKVRRQRSKASRKCSGRSMTTRTITPHPELCDSSDDSNYETLHSYNFDNFSSDSEDEDTQQKEIVPRTYLEAPTKPTPPPPREASLSQTLGKQMKMLRRTWSITKGSLGRMRRRTSGESEGSYEENGSARSPSDNRKYFSFKKHFRKSLSGLSTFYLDNNNVNGNSAKNTNGQDKVEPIYSNTSWYSEAGLYEDDSSSQSNGSKVDHYSVLAEEPLYQFYAAAAARVAFESDSDGYEEVEALALLSATTELVKPGHRTLWCQTPQVIHSDLLQRLSLEERKVQEAKFEIVTSEASYLNSLRVLENEFASNHELIHEILTTEEREKLFGGVPDVLVASEKFLAELEQIWREDSMLMKLPEVILKYAEKCSEVYVSYCSNQVSIDTTLKDLRAKKSLKFLEVVSRIEMHPACQSLSLHSFLMLPMQRVTRMPLLADAVLSKLPVDHNERLVWETVLSTLSHIVAECNEGARVAGRRMEMDSLARKLEYSKIPRIDLQERELIRSGTLIQLTTKSDSEYKLTFGKKFQKTPLYILLLTDYLLVTKLKTNSNEESYAVIDTCKRSLVALEAAPEDSPFAGRRAMVLTFLENHIGQQVEYILTCESDTERERWLDAVSPPKPTLVGETLYESWDCPQVMAVYSYPPAQPDELALQPGDVINVLRKMTDGWLYGEKLLDGEQGWFPGNYTKEVASEHVRARNLRQRHRFLALSGSVLQRKAKQTLSIH